MSQKPNTAAKTYRTGLPEVGPRAVRAALGGIVLRKWEISECGQGYVPETGPVIFASNHTGWLDGPLMFIRTPRDVHVLVKAEEFTGKHRLLLRATGQIKVARDQVDTKAMRQAASALAAGQTIGIFPEGSRGNGEFDSIKRGIGYLALVSGAPIVPMAMFGTREPGGAADSRPEKGARIDIVYGRPFTLQAQPWPRTADRIDAAVAQIRDLLRAHLASAKQSVNRQLPGDIAGSGDLVGAEAASRG